MRSQNKWWRAKREPFKYVDSFDKAAIQHKITEFYTVWKQLPTLNTLNSTLVIPPANCVCGRVYCFHVVRPSVCQNVRPSECVSVTFCFLNILENH